MHGNWALNYMPSLHCVQAADLHFTLTSCATRLQICTSAKLTSLISTYDIIALTMEMLKTLPLILNHWMHYWVIITGSAFLQWCWFLSHFALQNLDTVQEEDTSGDDQIQSLLQAFRSKLRSGKTPKKVSCSPSLQITHRSGMQIWRLSTGVSDLHACSECWHNFRDLVQKAMLCKNCPQLAQTDTMQNPTHSISTK